MTLGVNEPRGPLIKDRRKQRSALTPNEMGGGGEGQD